jgi:hypothetical protein
LVDDVLDVATDRLERDRQRLQGLGCGTFVVVGETEEDVLSVDLVVVQQPSFFLG